MCPVTIAVQAEGVPSEALAWDVMRHIKALAQTNYQEVRALLVDNDCLRSFMHRSPWGCSMTPGAGPGLQAGRSMWLSLAKLRGAMLCWVIHEVVSHADWSCCLAAAAP